MERSPGRTGGWAFLILSCLLSRSLTWGIPSGGRDAPANQSATCSADEFAHRGYCCNRGHPGFRMTKACAGAGLRTTCEPCSNGTYLELSNAATKCIKCRKCESDEMEASPCRAGKNRECRCRPGLYVDHISPYTRICKPCAQCGPGFRKKTPCTHDANAVCECLESYYLASNGSCVPCVECNSRKECSHLCPTSTTPREPMKVAPPPEIPNNWWQTIAISLAVAMACAVVVVGGRRIHKRIRRSRASSYYTGNTCIQSTTSQNSELLPSPTASLRNCDPVFGPFPPQHKQPELPDCVPRTINISQFLYSVMEVVPVSRWKELIRRLGVSEREIERAERDNRVYSEAQYYMIQLWSRAGGGGGGLSPSLPLPRPLALSLLQTLREMGLGGCAEQLDQRYNISLE
nr:tumor necrosis factor receptor superfamily member 1A [Lepisosteus oculatus]